MKQEEELTVSVITSNEISNHQENLPSSDHSQDEKTQFKRLARKYIENNTQVFFARRNNIGAIAAMLTAFYLSLFILIINNYFKANKNDDNQFNLGMFWGMQILFMVILTISGGALGKYYGHARNFSMERRCEVLKLYDEERAKNFFMRYQKEFHLDECQIEEFVKFMNEYVQNYREAYIKEFLNSSDSSNSSKYVFSP